MRQVKQAGVARVSSGMKKIMLASIMASTILGCGGAEERVDVWRFECVCNSCGSFDSAVACGLDAEAAAARASDDCCEGVGYCICSDDFEGFEGGGVCEETYGGAPSLASCFNSKDYASSP